MTRPLRLVIATLVLAGAGVAAAGSDPRPALADAVTDPSLAALDAAPADRRAHPGPRAIARVTRGGAPLDGTIAWPDTPTPVVTEEPDAVRAKLTVRGATLFPWIARAELDDVIQYDVGLAATATARA